MGALTYATVGSNSLKDALSFFDALLASAGISPLFDHPSGGRAYGRNGQLMFAVLGPFDGAPATTGNGTMAAFHFDTTGEVAAFHTKAIELGARDAGAPGYRTPNFFMSYFRDLDGNKICAFHQVAPANARPQITAQ